MVLPYILASSVWRYCVLIYCVLSGPIHGVGSYKNKGIGIEPMPHRYDHSHANIKPVVYPPDFILHVVINTAVERTVVELERIPAVNPGFPDERSSF